MRISDWSSDVCSSDLAVEGENGDAIPDGDAIALQPGGEAVGAVIKPGIAELPSCLQLDEYRAVRRQFGASGGDVEQHPHGQADFRRNCAMPASASAPSILPMKCSFSCSSAAATVACFCGGQSSCLVQATADRKSTRLNSSH